MATKIPDWPKLPKAPPANLAKCADLAYELRETRYRLQHEVDKIEEMEKLCKQRILDELPKQKAKGTAGQLARAELKPVTIPQFEQDVGKGNFTKMLKKTGEFDLATIQINKKAVMERWEAGKTVPGVIAFKTTAVSLTKL